MHFKPFMLSFADRKINSIHLKLAFSAGSNPDFAAAAFSTRKPIELVSKYEFTYREFKKLSHGDEVKFCHFDSDGNLVEEISLFIGHAVDFKIPVHNGNLIEKRFVSLFAKGKDRRGKEAFSMVSVGDTIEVLAPIPHSTDSRFQIAGCWLSWPVDYDIPASAYANIPVTTK